VGGQRLYARLRRPAAARRAHGDLLGRRRIFIAGIALFAIASLAGGFAQNQPELLIARIIQGIGARSPRPPRCR